MRKIFYFIFLAGLTIFLFNCGVGDEGLVEGIIDGKPFRMEVENVVAIRGSTDSYYDPYTGYPVVYSNGLIIYLPDTDILTSSSPYTLVVQIYDLGFIARGVPEPVHGNVDAYFEYITNNQTYRIDAVSGQCIFTNVGYYEGDRITGFCDLGFNDGSTLSSDFNTKVGLTR
jgi:hypothetical protein